MLPPAGSKGMHSVARLFCLFYHQAVKFSNIVQFIVLYTEILLLSAKIKVICNVLRLVAVTRASAGVITL